MKLLHKMASDFRELNRGSVAILRYGFELSAGLLLASYFFFWLAGRYGNVLTALACARGALDAAPMTATFTVAGALVLDLAVRDRKNRSE